MNKYMVVVGSNSKNGLAHLYIANASNETEAGSIAIAYIGGEVVDVHRIGIDSAPVAEPPVKVEVPNV